MADLNREVSLIHKIDHSIDQLRAALPGARLGLLHILLADLTAYFISTKESALSTKKIEFTRQLVSRFLNELNEDDTDIKEHLYDIMKHRLNPSFVPESEGLDNQILEMVEKPINGGSLTRKYKRKSIRKHRRKSIRKSNKKRRNKP